MSQKEVQKKSLVKSIRNLFIKASLNLSLAASKIRNFADEVLSSDEVVNELFLVSSSSSISSSLLDQEVHLVNSGTTNTAQQVTSTSPIATQGQISQIMATDAQSTSNNNAKSIITSDTFPEYEEFNVVDEANKIREQRIDEPFSSGDKLWVKRRSIWLNSTTEEKLRAQKKSLENSLLIGVSKDDYSIIYQSLIEKQKTLKKPMNLKDAIKIIDSEWTVTKKWERAAQGIA